MANQDQEDDNKKLVEAYEKLLADWMTNNPGEVEQELREAGYDVNALKSKFGAAAKNAFAESPLNWRNAIDGDGG